MLTITVGGKEVYDDATGEFGNQGGFELQLEHSLFSLSKWESEFEKPFLAKEAKTPEEVVAYIQHMVVTPNPPADFFLRLSKENMEEINAYIEKKMTATWFHDAQPQTRGRAQIITAELIYYWMTAFNIDWECQYWHLNRLFTLIRICNIKQDNTPKKMSKAEVAARNRELNAQRKQQLGTKG